MSRVRSYISVSAEVDIADVVNELSDAELEAYGLRRVASNPDGLREQLYDAAARGDCAAMLRTIEAIAWEVDGKILVTRLAA